MAGTDAMNPFCFPGFSLHDELAMMVDSGLTPLAVRQSATINPAKFLAGGESKLNAKDFSVIEHPAKSQISSYGAPILSPTSTTNKNPGRLAARKIFRPSRLGPAARNRKASRQTLVIFCRPLRR